MLTAATAATMADVDGGGRHDSHDDGWSARPPTPMMTACPSSTSVTPLGLLLPPPALPPLIVLNGLTIAQLKTMSPSILHPANMTANYATSKSLFLLRDKDNSEIMTLSLLLPLNQDNPAITTATHAQNLLLYAQIGSAITTAIHAQNLLLFFVRNDPANSKLHLIVAFIRRALTAQTNVNLILVSEGEHQVTSVTIHNDSSS